MRERLLLVALLEKRQQAVSSKNSMGYQRNANQRARHPHDPAKVWVSAIPPVHVQSLQPSIHFTAQGFNTKALAAVISLSSSRSEAASPETRTTGSVPDKRIRIQEPSWQIIFSPSVRSM